MRNVEDTDFSVRIENETEPGKSATYPHQSAWKPIYNGSGTKILHLIPLHVSVILDDAHNRKKYIYFLLADHFYVVPNLKSGIRYQFRVQAFNDMGASEVSESSPTFQMTSSNSSITMIVLVSALIAFCSVMFIFLFYGTYSHCFSLYAYPAVFIQQAISY